MRERAREAQPNPRAGPLQLPTPVRRREPLTGFPFLLTTTRAPLLFPRGATRQRAEGVSPPATCPADSRVCPRGRPRFLTARASPFPLAHESLAAEP